MEKALDISKWQTSFNATTAASAGITTVICRLAHNSKDVKLDTFAPAVKKAGMKLGGYGYATWHYKSVNGGSISKARTKMKSEVKLWISLAKSAGVNSWLAIDQELESGETLGLSAADNTTLLNEACKLIKDSGFNPCIYASAAWIWSRIQYAKVSYPFWVAYYLYPSADFSGTNNGVVPSSAAWKKVFTALGDKVCAWQYGSTGHGKQYGCGSTNVDRDWVYYQPASTTTSSTDDSTNTAITSTSSNYYCVVTANALNVRKGAGTGYDVVTTVKKGNVLHISKMDGKWGYVSSKGGWVSTAYVSKSIGTATITCHSLTVRASASLSGTVKGYANKGDILTVIRKVTSGGKNWYQLSTGYYCSAGSAYSTFKAS